VSYILLLLQNHEDQEMKKRISQIIIVLTALALILSSSTFRISTFESSTPFASALVLNSVSALTIETFDSNGVNNSKTFSLDEIYAMPKTTVYADLSCYGRFIVSGLWGGVSLRVLLAEAAYTEPTANLLFYASDGYTTTLTVSDDTSQDVIVAYELESSSLPEILRLVIPNANGEAWISMITSISINSPVYVSSPNPDAATIIFNNPTQQQPITAQPSPTPQPTNQPTTEPTTPQPTNPPQTNQSSPYQNTSSSSSPKEYNYPIIVGTIAALTMISLGYFFHKRKKEPKTLN
jgi:hypothetical protein